MLNIYMKNTKLIPQLKQMRIVQSLPTNPFEIVEMIRRQNSLNEATKPSDAIDEALNSFNNMEEE